ncbi:murein biosynthesis integral membrane protein MurJ [Streptomyces ardesiacus]|uniref:murein biosynthesis integral membrane protein MurJ n=1 Tax=Streptomyces ardesiacus TaxID=285564 RepID=UPI0036E06F27
MTTTPPRTGDGPGTPPGSGTLDGPGTPPGSGTLDGPGTPPASGTLDGPGTPPGSGALDGPGGSNPPPRSSAIAATTPHATTTARTRCAGPPVAARRPAHGTGTAPGPGPAGTRAPAGTAAPPARLPAAPATPATPRPESAPSAEGRSSGSFLARAALVTAVLSVAGSVLGLVRDQALARLFGAGGGTDAFLVAWTVPEFAATLLIEDGLAFALVPMFSLALARRARGVSGDPVRALVASTLPRLAAAFAAAGALVAVAAPVLVRALAPGLPDQDLAVDCTRLTATCVVSFGLAGYCSAALRAHRRFSAPAAIYVAYNTGIVAVMYVLGGRWGVRSAAAGVAVGGFLMVAAQLPSLLRRLRRREGGRAATVPDDGPARPVALALFATVLLFALCRQSQVLIERFLASGLPSGAISHLNYAQKVAQIPMTLSLMLCTVTFPVVARALADGDTERARDRVERDVALAACLVLLGAATVVACAPQIVHLLFQRGAFTADDTVATAGVMRVYALGLLGQTVVGALSRSYFSAGRASWYPFAAMAAGVVVTAVAGASAVGPWGVSGIAAANAAGITVTAALLLAGMGPRSVPVRVRRVLADLGRPVLAAAVATCAGSLAAGPVTGAGTPSAALSLAVGATTVGGVFVVLCLALGVRGPARDPRAARSVRSVLHPVTQRHPHGRSRFRFPFRNDR